MKCCAAVVFAMFCVGPTAVWALDLRSGVPEGDIEVYFDVLVSHAVETRPTNSRSSTWCRSTMARGGWPSQRSKAGCA